MSPLVDRGMVIVHVGGHNRGALTAFDATTGAVKWSWTGDGPSYGSPMAADFDGTRQIIVFTQENLVGVSAAKRRAALEASVHDPLDAEHDHAALLQRHGDCVGSRPSGHGVQDPEARQRVDNRGRLGECRRAALHDERRSRARHDRRHDAQEQRSVLRTRRQTGKTLWTSEPRQATNAAILRAGSDLLFALKDDAELIVARPSASGLDPVKRYTVADSATWALPTVVGNRIYVKDTNSLTLWTW
jgi:hypothetical protein